MASYSTKKCKSCGEWANGGLYNCEFCGNVLDEHDRRVEIREEVVATELERLRLIDEARTPFQRKVHRVFSIAQAIYMGITTFIAWLVAWVAG